MLSRTSTRAYTGTELSRKSARFFGLACGDVNGDARPDIVSTTESSDCGCSVVLFLNLGSGAAQFSEEILLFSGRGGANEVVLADVDAGGLLDPVFVCEANANHTLAWISSADIARLRVS